MNQILPRAVVFVLTIGAASSASAFDYFEHRWLGNMACALVAARTPEWKRPCTLVEPKDGLRSLTFGDLVALAGDHFQTPEELELAAKQYYDPRPCVKFLCKGKQKLEQILIARDLQQRSAGAWLDGRRDALACHDQITRPLGLPPELTVASADGCIAAQASLVRDEKVAPPLEEATLAGDCYKPDPIELNEFARLPGYAYLASRNYLHFGQLAAQEWAARHEQAKTALRSVPATQPPDLHALVMEAFALHFLTDRFAAGHMRTPRSVLSNMEAKREHDFDNANGLRVNGCVSLSVQPQLVGKSFTGSCGPLNPIEWETYGDDCLLGRAAPVHQAMTLLAATRALGEFWLARKGQPDNSALPIVALPNYEHSTTRPVPTDVRFVTVTLEPSSSWLGEVTPGAPFTQAGSIASRIRYEFNFFHWLSPPALEQLALFGSDGTIALAPASLDALDGVLWLSSFPARVQERWADRLRNARQRIATFAPRGVHFLGFNVGYAIVRPRTNLQWSNAVHLSHEIRIELFDRWSIGILGDAFLYDLLSGTKAIVSVGLALDMRLN